MMRFFKRIRHKLFTENKFNRYLVYALGEIFLVVIGILLALQINNWNEQRKSNQLKTKYFKQLLDDFDRDKSSINFSIKRLDRNIDDYKDYTEKLKTPNLHLDTVYTFLKKIDFKLGSTEFNFQTFNTLQSTGDLRLFKSELKNALMALNTLQLDYLENAKSSNAVYLDLIKLNKLAFKDSYLNELGLQKNIYGKGSKKELFSEQIADLNHALRFKNSNENSYRIKLNNILNQLEELEEFIEAEIVK